MSMITAIRCRCGHRVVAREVLQRGFLMVQWKPVYVYVKYRCARCKRLGKEFIDYEAWDEAILRDFLGNSDPEEAARFEGLGPIAPTEIVAFRRELRREGARAIEALHEPL